MSPMFMAWKVNRCSWAHKPHSTCSFDDRYWSDFYCTCPQIRTTRFKIHMFFSFCNATQIRIAFSCAEKCSTPSQYYINHCPNMSKVVVKYPKIWIQSQKKEAKPCSCFSLRLLDCLPQFLWLLHLVCGPDEKPRCLLLFLPWMFSCASLFWNGSFGRRESLINLSAVTPQTNPKYIYIHIYIYIVVCFLFCPVFYLWKQNLRCGCTTNHEGCHTLKTVVNKWKVFRDVFGCVRFAWTMWMPWLLWLP